MEDFFQVFFLVLISLCIVNLISSVYPQTKSKHTLMIAFSVIGVYLCVTPISTLFNSLRSLEPFSVESVVESFQQDFEDKNYTDVLKSVLARQIETEIEGKYKNIEAEVILKIENDDTVENDVLEVDEILIFGANEDEEGYISEYVRGKYAVTPIFEKNTRD